MHTSSLFIGALAAAALAQGASTYSHPEPGKGAYLIAVQFKDLSCAGEVTVTHSSNEMAMAVNSFTRSIKFVQTATYKTYSGSLSADKLSCGGKEIVANLRVNTKDECHQVDGRSTHCFLSVPGTEGDSH